VLQVRFEGLSGDVDGAHSHISECVIADGALGALDLTGAVLSDVSFTAVRATEVKARTGRWRTVLISGGRIGTLDLSGADLTGIELRGVRIDYLALGSAKVSDLLVVDCTIGSLDIPLATLSRVRFEGTRVDEVDSRGIRADHLDLRGLDALAYTDLSSLRGATLSGQQVELLATSFAAALGIDVRD